MNDEYNHYYGLQSEDDVRHLAHLDEARRQQQHDEARDSLRDIVMFLGRDECLRIISEMA